MGNKLDTTRPMQNPKRTVSGPLAGMKSGICMGATVPCRTVRFALGAERTNLNFLGHSVDVFPQRAVRLKGAFHL